MKEKLLQFQNLHLLKRNEKLYSDCCYILNSESVAQNTYFETKRDILWAHKMIRRHLSHVLDIVDYLFTPNGWMLVVATKSEEEILSNISKAGYKSRKIKKAISKKNISVLLSEVLRYTISSIARITNRYNRRGGCLVRNNFNRLIFETYETAEYVMKKMREEQIKLCHQRKRYRPNMHWYDKGKEMEEKGDVFLCSKNWRKGGSDGEGAMKLSINHFLSYVLRERICDTVNNYNPKIYSKIYPNPII